MKTKCYLLLGLCFMAGVKTALAQALSGPYTINNAIATGGTNFQSFYDAITALNINGVDPSTGVSFSVSAGQTFVEPKLTLHANGSSAGRIVFASSGGGPNPVITPASAGTVNTTALGANGDFIFRIAGSDYVTIDGIDVTTSPAFTTDPARIEYGYLVTRLNANNGSKNIEIKNCKVTLDRTKTYSTGIFFSHLDTTGASVTVTSTDGRHESNLIYGNWITNAYNGIMARGFAQTTAPYNFFDHYGIIDSNRIDNFAGSSVECYGIYVVANDSMRVTRNLIDGAATVTPATLYGIQFPASASVCVTVNNNTIQNLRSNTLYGINVSAGNTKIGNKISISFNEIKGCSAAVAATSGLYYSLYCNGGADSVVVTNNKIHDNYMMVGGSSVYNIWIIPNGGSKVDLSYNEIYNLYNIGLTGTGTIFPMILNNDGTVEHVNANKIYNIIHNSASGEIYGVRTNAAKTVFSNNFISHMYAPNSTSATAVTGLDANVEAVYMYHNTIVLNATTNSAGTFGTACVAFRGGTSGVNEAINNILVNTSSVGPTAGISSCIRRTTAANLTNYSTLSDNNCLYVDTTLTRRALYTDGTNHYRDIVAMKTAIAPRESATFIEFPPFVDTSVTTRNFHLIFGAGTLCKMGGKPIVSALVSIDKDFDGEVRNASTPDVGADEVNAPVPVKLRQLAASRRGVDVVVSWTTASEVNADYFELQRSIDAKSFGSIGKITALGNSVKMTNYAFTDYAAPDAAIIYYRLKSVDRDGKYEYSGLVTVKPASDETAEKLLVYPNPSSASAELTIDLPEEGDAVIEVRDWSGKVIKTDSLHIPAGKSTVQVPGISDLGAGVYVLSVKTKNIKRSAKLVKR